MFSSNALAFPGAANVTVKVLDKNDNAPSFERTQYDAIVAETAPVGSAVISVSATDPDDEAMWVSESSTRLVAVHGAV